MAELTHESAEGAKSAGTPEPLTREVFLPLWRETLAASPELAAKPEIFSSDEAAEKLFRIAERLTANARRFNLTSILAPRDIAEKHLADSLVPLSILLDCGLPLGEDLGEPYTVLDVGTGAGFPLLPWAAVLPDDPEILSFTGLDATGKKLAHVRESAEYAGLRTVRTVQGRAEDCARKPGMREAFDLVTARAVAPLPVLAELCAPFVKPGGFFAALKSVPQAEEDGELGAARPAFKKLGLGGQSSGPEIFRFSLPNGDPRSLVLCKKRGLTPREYPRRWAEITKRPIV